MWPRDANAERQRLECQDVSDRILGTGLLGSGMVENLLRRGHQVTVWNRTASQARALAAVGATVARSPEEAVASVERVHVALSDDAAVDAMLERIASSVGRAVVIDLSS